MDRYRGWGCFFSVVLTALGITFLGLARYRTPPGSKLGVALIGLLIVLAAARFMVAAFTGRVPLWMQELIDADE